MRSQAFRITSTFAVNCNVIRKISVPSRICAVYRFSSKQQVRGSEPCFRSNKYPDGICNCFHTSGTEITPIVISETPASFARRWAFVARLRSWLGVSNPFYPRRAQFTGRDITSRTRKPIYWRRNYPAMRFCCRPQTSRANRLPDTRKPFASFGRSWSRGIRRLCEFSRAWRAQTDTNCQKLGRSSFRPKI